jgi:oxalate---CoA ligase
MNLPWAHIGGVHDLALGEHWPPTRLAAAVQARAAVLQGLGAGAVPQRFVIAHGNSASFFADLFAVWQLGGCAVCVNPNLATSELANVVDFVKPAAVLVANGAGAANTARALGPVPLVCTEREPPPTPRKGQTPRRPTLDDAALVLFTSGTTGVPKGVVHSHRSLQARVALNQAHIGAQVLARSLCVLPTHFGHGLIGNALTPLLAGGELFLWPQPGVAAMSRLAEVIETQRISFMSSVPAFWKLALKVSRAPQAGLLQRVHIGSAPLSAELWRGVMAWAGTRQVANLYGITETCNWIGGASAGEFEPEDGLLGRTWGGHWAVRADDGQYQAQGRGEICVRTPSLMSGYLDRPELDEAVLGDGWYHSGDIGHIDSQGVLRMTGRSSQVINRAGMKIHPEELDLLFERHEQVLEACAFAMPDAASGEAAAIALRLRDGAVLSQREMVEWARSRIRAEALPQRVFIVADIPKNERGKFNRTLVAQRCLAGPDGP